VVIEFWCDLIDLLYLFLKTTKMNMHFFVCELVNDFLYCLEGAYDALSSLSSHHYSKIFTYNLRV
jgi:hypothetical protein